MKQGDRSIFFGLKILTETGFRDNQLVIVDENKIKLIAPLDEIKHYLPAKQFEFPQNYYLIPGFIDLHIHGAAGKDVMDASDDGLKTITHALAKEGVTGFLATTMTAQHSHIEAALQTVKNVMSQDEGARILGVHLEGPFIAKAKMGAQYASFLQSPDVLLIDRWKNIFPNMIRLVTLAPELQGAREFIQYLHQHSIIASIGHTDASYTETQMAIDAGCTHATHLFNAMRGLHQREPGALGALLLADEIMAEFIVDGIHLHPAIVDLAFKLKGAERLLLVTDAMRAKCMGDGQYDLGGQEVEVKAGKALLPDGTLAGSTLCMPDAIKNLIKFTHCSLEDAIHMATRNPAKQIKLFDHKGSIAPGKDADLVILDTKLDVVLTMREGRVIYPHQRGFF